MKWSLGVSLEAVTVLSPYVLFSRRFNKSIMAFFLVCKIHLSNILVIYLKDLLHRVFLTKIQISKCKMISISSVPL